MRPGETVKHRWPVLQLAAACALASTACSATDDRAAVWEYLSPVIFQPNCATTSCHSRAAAVAGLDFSDPDRGYTSLTDLWVWVVDPNGTIADGCRPLQGSVVCQRNNRPLVSPYNPSQSRVVNMLRAQSASRMPPERPLSEADIRLVEKWILNGASKSAAGPGADAHATPTDAGSDGDAGGGARDGNADTAETVDAPSTTDVQDAADGRS